MSGDTKLVVEDFLERKKQINEEIEDLSKITYKFANKKQYTLEDRFKVWEKCVEKEHNCWIFSDKKFPLIYDYIHDGLINDYIHKYEKVDYNQIITNYEEATDEDGERFEDSVIESLKEELIASNFGSCCCDW